MACCRCGSRRLRSRTAEAVRAVRGQRAGSTRAASASKNGECAANVPDCVPRCFDRERGRPSATAGSARSQKRGMRGNVPDCIPRCFDRERGRPSATAGSVRFQKRGMRGNVPTAFPGVFYKEATVFAPAALSGQSSPRRMRTARAATRPAHSRSCCPAPSLPQANSRISRPSSTQSSS